MELVLQKSMTATESPWNAAAEIYDMMVDGQAVGHVSLRLEDKPWILAYIGHIGYRVKPEHQGHHYAEAACRLVLPIARGRGLTTVWISCNPDNTASVRTIERLGATYVDTIDLPKDSRYYPRGERQKRRYRMDLY